MRTRLLLPLFLWFVCTADIVAQPRTPSADYSREAYVIEQSHTAWRFENDGTGRKDTYVRVKVQSDASVQRWGQLVLGYNAANERMEIVSVQVHKPDGTTVSASSSAVQDLNSHVERIAPIYTDSREKHVTVPGLRPGDTLEFASRTTVHTALAPGQFWTEYDFSKTGVVLDEQLQIDVPADRAVTLRTRPGLDTTIANRDGRRIYEWHAVRLTDEHADERTKNQPRRKHPEPAAVRLTTFKDWETVGRWYAQLERTPKAPTPEIRRKAAELTAGRATDLQKLEALYEYVAENFRYVSLSFGAGRYQPHAAGDVLRNQYGDCKDKHTLLASLAESAGLRASAALINSRGEIDPDFPSPSQFDHVITRATADGRDVWLDTTPEVAPFRLLSAALRKKHALVVDGDTARLVETPEESPVPHSSAVQIDASLDDAGLLSARVRLAFTGDFELLMRTIFRQTPKTEWKTILKSMMAREGLDSEAAEWKVADPAALREPFTIEYQTKKTNFVTWTNKQFDFNLPLIDFLSTLHDADDDESVELGPPRRSTYTLRLALPRSYSTHAPLAVFVARDYGEYRADYSLEGQVFTAERTFTVRQSELKRDRRDDYRAFRRVVSGDLKQVLALERGATAIVAAPAEWKADELYTSGYEALENGSYAQALALLKRVTELEPAHRTAWNQLGRAYLELKQTDEAIAAFRKQIAINAYDPYSYNNLGRAYSAARKFSDAEAAFQKQLEINPLDGYAHASLGKLYLEWRKYQPAAAELEKAIALSPKDATLRIRLGEAYLNLEQRDRAIATFDRAVEIRPGDQSWNEIAYQLALHGTDLELAQRYAESAVSEMAVKSRNLSLNRITAWDLYYIANLAANWDTLGWVHFAEGDLSGAEKFVRASWLLLHNSEVGDHLAQIYEQLGKRSEAVRMYALALNAERPDEKTRERLAALLGDERHVDAVVSQHRDDLMRERTIAVDGRGPAGATADVLILLGRGSVEDVKFVEGDERLRSLADTLRTIKYEAVFPDDAPAKIVRRGTLSCSLEDGAVSCRLVLLLPRDAQLAHQN